MDNKNALILIITGVATLFVTVIGATYAYFSASLNLDDTVPVGVTTEAASALFMSQTTGEIDLTVSFSEMSELDANDEVAQEGLTDSSTLSTMITAPSEGTISSCTYDIIFTWDKDSDEYKRTEGPIKEFTIEGEANVVNGVELNNEQDPNGLYVINSPVLAEINMDELDWKTKKVYETIGEETYENEIKYALLIDNATISSNTNLKATIQEYTFTVRYYNTTFDQTEAMGMKYMGTISIDEDSITC